MNWLFRLIQRIITRFIGDDIQSKYEYLPTIPVANIVEISESLVRLSQRQIQTMQAKQGLSMSYTIDGEIKTGYQFLYGAGTEDVAIERTDNLQRDLQRKGSLATFRSALSPENVVTETMDSHPFTKLSLEEPHQFAMSWSVLPDTYNRGKKYLSTWTRTLTDAKTATHQFWPTIAQYGLPLNTLMLEKVTTSEQQKVLKAKFGAAWTPEIDDLATDGQLYFIDLSIFTTVKPQHVDGCVRFTPATITLLQQDLKTKDLTPIAIRVSGNQDTSVQIYTDLYVVKSFRTQEVSR